MGKIVGVIVLLVVFVAGAVMFVPSVRARVLGVPLELQFVEGREYRTKTVLEGKIKLEVSGLPDNLLPKEASALFSGDVPFKLETRSLQVVKSVTKDSIEMDASSSGGTLEIRLPGAPTPTTYPIPPTVASRVKLDSNGRPQPEIPATTEGLTPQDMHKVQDFIATLATASVPGATKRVGATWTTPLELDVKNGAMAVLLKGALSSTFKQVTQKNVATVADIAGSQDLSVDVAFSKDGFDLKLTGSVKGDNDSYLDWTAGQIVLTEGNEHVDLALTVKTQKPQAIDAKAHVTGDVKMTVEKL